MGKFLLQSLLTTCMPYGSRSRASSVIVLVRFGCVELFLPVTNLRAALSSSTYQTSSIPLLKLTYGAHCRISIKQYVHMKTVSTGTATGVKPFWLFFLIYFYVWREIQKSHMKVCLNTRGLIIVYIFDYCVVKSVFVYIVYIQQHCWVVKSD